METNISILIYYSVAALCKCYGKARQNVGIFQILVCVVEQPEEQRCVQVHPRGSWKTSSYEVKNKISKEAEHPTQHPRDRAAKSKYIK